MHSCLGEVGYIGKISALVDGNLMEKTSLYKVLSTQRNMSAKNQHKTCRLSTGKKPYPWTCTHTYALCNRQVYSAGDKKKKGNKLCYITQSYNLWAQQPPKMLLNSVVDMRKREKKDRHKSKVNLLILQKKTDAGRMKTTNIYPVVLQPAAKIHVYEPN